jgi:heme/copper-type cytochrome/quinol oxidase subunit 4
MNNNEAILTSLGIVLVFGILFFWAIKMKQIKKEQIPGKKKQNLMLPNVISLVLAVLLTFFGALAPLNNSYPNVAERIMIVLMGAYLPATLLNVIVSGKKQSMAWSIMPIVFAVVIFPLLYIAAFLLRG